MILHSMLRGKRKLRDKPFKPVLGVMLSEVSVLFKAEIEGHTFLKIPPYLKDIKSYYW